MISVPSPVAIQGLVFLSSGHNLVPIRPIVAIRPEASGDITPPTGQSQSQSVAWSHRTGGAYVTSPIAVDEYLYVPQDKGSLMCYEARTGKTVYEEQKLGRRNTITASPAAGDARSTSRLRMANAAVMVAAKRALSSKFWLSTSSTRCSVTSPAVSAGRIYLRGRKHLYCIGKRCP